MKVTGPTPGSALALSQKVFLKPLNHPDLNKCASAAAVIKTRRKSRNPTLTRLTRLGSTSGGRIRPRSRPETPLLKWKIEDRAKGRNGGLDVEVDEVDFEEAKADSAGGGRRGRKKMVSARKLGAALWRLQVPETVVTGGRKDWLGFQVTSFSPKNIPGRVG